MTRWILAVLVVAFAGVLALHDAQAARLGGGRSFGAQRAVPRTPPAAVPAKPTQPSQQAAPATSGSRWGGILGGLALGGLLGYLFAGNGFGGVLLLALLAFAVILVVRALASRASQAPQPLRYAGADERRSTQPAQPQPQTAAGQAAATPPSALPPGFDVNAFLKNAKTNFVKLQIANDFGRLSELREFTTDEMYDELRREIFGRRGGSQQTDVVALNADLLEIATEGERHWASVRFSGMVREAPGTQLEGFEEVWNLVKPADGSSGWLLAGIQQMH